MHNILKTRTFLSFFSILLYSSEMLAHVKWFVDTDKVQLDNFQPYSFSDPEVLIWIGLACIMILFAIFLDLKLPSLPIIKSQSRHNIIELLRICSGISLLLTAYNGSIIAPHYQAYGGFGIALLFLQGFIGISFIANRFTLHSSMLLIILYLGLIIQFDFYEVVEYINIIGISLFLILNNLPSIQLQKKYKSYSVDSLRIFTGISLIILGVSEKIIGAEYGQAFVATYDWNFMSNWGISLFTDRLFVLSAGVMEVVFGIILILGVVTRLNTLVIAIFMLASNITFLFQSNQSAALTELIGHLPIIASAVIFIFLGFGQRLRASMIFIR